MERSNLRKNDELRTIKITKNYTCYANGSVLAEFGNTKVICTATVENKLPGWLKESGTGWLTAEYGMLPGSSQNRIDRKRNQDSGRTKEIARLIGRTLRAVIDFKALGERTITIDCDVIQADGGTRTTSINGGMVALALAMLDLREKGEIDKSPITNFAAAISVGLISGKIILDLDYREDSAADVDMNIAMLSDGNFIELQGTAEHENFSRSQLDELINMAQKGISEVIEFQKKTLGEDVKWLLSDN